MSIETIAQTFQVEPKTVRNFFRSNPALFAIDPDRLTSDSITELQPLFTKWHGPLPVIEETEPQPEIDLIDNENAIMPVECLQFVHTAQIQQKVRDISNAQESWLEQRLQELGISRGAKKKDVKWRTEYDAGKIDKRRRNDY
ncbi:MAG: hypothetical protein ACREOZ_00650 [Gloeomargaritales cyanobacterium]